MPRWFAAALLALATYHVWRARIDASRARAIAARPRVEPLLDRTPRVTILVAAWNESERIGAHIASILRLRYPNVEYIVCAGGADDTAAIARDALGDRGIVIEQTKGDGKQRALRRALAHATGEIVYLTDADCVIDDLAFESTIAPIIRGWYRVVTGRSRPFRHDIDTRPLVASQWAAPYLAESLQGEESRGLLGRNCAVDRAALRRAGDLAEDVATGTDYHLARKLRRDGETIGFARDSFVESSSPPSIAAYVRQQRRWLRNHWIHAAATGEIALQRHAVQTWAVGLMVAVLPFLALASDPRILYAWLLLVAHGAASRLRYVRFVAVAERVHVPMVAYAATPIAFILDAVAWAGSLLEMASARARANW
ncbi:MAG: glycosyltransferase [Chloroflexota bacterium]|nr:MAG: glycosyltransferase [Chloroflexota bacterium]